MDVEAFELSARLAAAWRASRTSARETGGGVTQHLVNDGYHWTGLVRSQRSADFEHAPGVLDGLDRAIAGSGFGQMQRGFLDMAEVGVGEGEVGAQRDLVALEHGRCLATELFEDVKGGGVGELGQHDGALPVDEGGVRDTSQGDEASWAVAAAAAAAWSRAKHTASRSSRAA